jgi:hypothetical protein
MHGARLEFVNSTVPKVSGMHAGRPAAQPGDPVRPQTDRHDRTWSHRNNRRAGVDENKQQAAMNAGAVESGAGVLSQKARGKRVWCAIRVLAEEMVSSAATTVGVRSFGS